MAKFTRQLDSLHMSSDLAKHAQTALKPSGGDHPRPVGRTVPVVVGNTAHMLTSQKCMACCVHSIPSLHVDLLNMLRCLLDGNVTQSNTGFKRSSCCISRVLHEWAPRSGICVNELYQQLLAWSNCTGFMYLTFKATFACSIKGVIKGERPITSTVAN